MWGREEGRRVHVCGRKGGKGACVYVGSKGGKCGRGGRVHVCMWGGKGGSLEGGEGRKWGEGQKWGGKV